MEKVTSSHEFNGAMIGIILFDGSMPSEKYLYIRHGGNQLSYVDSKVELISNYIKPTSVRTTVDKKGFTYRYAYYNTERLKHLYKDIYIKGKKTLTDSILNRFTALTLAIMYMDDGSLVLHKDPKRPGQYHSREIYLAVNSFTLEEVTKLQKHLKNKWGCEFRISKNKGSYRLCCNSTNAIKFCTIVAPYVKQVPSLSYKLDFKYLKKQLPF